MNNTGFHPSENNLLKYQKKWKWQIKITRNVSIYKYHPHNQTVTHQNNKKRNNWGKIG